MDENCKSMLSIWSEWCVVSAPCSKATEVRKILSTVRLSKCKKLHSILYSHSGPKTDRSDSRPIETNGTSILECYSILRACWCILGHSSFLWGYICAYQPMCVFACVFDILGRNGERGQIADSLSHINGLLSFIHRNKSTPLPPPTLLGMIHAFVLYCLPGKHTRTHKHTLFSFSVCLWAHAFLHIRQCEWLLLNPFSVS